MNPQHLNSIRLWIAWLKVAQVCNYLGVVCQTMAIEGSLSSARTLQMFLAFLAIQAGTTLLLTITITYNTLETKNKEIPRTPHSEATLRGFGFYQNPITSFYYS